MTESLRLAPITPANVETAMAVRVRPDQERFVSPVATSARQSECWT
ncbi:hypothetical protein [Microbispora bryophytorum]